MQSSFPFFHTIRLLGVGYRGDEILLCDKAELMKHSSGNSHCGVQVIHKGKHPGRVMLYLVLVGYHPCII